MERYLNGRSAMWLGGVVIAGLGWWAARKAMAFELDIDPWEEMYGAY